MEQEIVCVVGHKSPDTDTVCSSIVYADYLKSQGLNAQAFVLGDINPETRYVLEYFKAPLPPVLDSAKERQVVLLDHNEKSQSPEGIEEAKILQILDHHKICFEWKEPIIFHTEPLGSTATIVAKTALADPKFTLDAKNAGLLLSAILSDTVVFKSATATQEDKDIAGKLASLAGIEDLNQFGIEIKKQKASLKALSAEQIINSDYKEFEAGGKKFSIGQVELVDLSEAKERESEIWQKMEEIRTQKNFDFIALMETDIINEGTQLLVAGNSEIAEKAFDKKFDGQRSVYLPNALSRKKDILPPLLKAME